MCPNNPIGTVDLYMVSHHGLDQSGSPVLVQALQPRVAVMQNGTRKGAGAQAMPTMRSSPGLEDIWQLHWSYGAGIEQNSAGVYIANVDDNATIAGILTAPPRGGGPGRGRRRATRRSARGGRRRGARPVRWRRRRHRARRVRLPPARRPPPAAGAAPPPGAAPQGPQEAPGAGRGNAAARAHPGLHDQDFGAAGRHRSRSPTRATGSPRPTPRVRGHARPRSTPGFRGVTMRSTTFAYPSWPSRRPRCSPP